MAARGGADRTPFAVHGHMQEITPRVILRAVLGLDEGDTMQTLEARLIEFLKPPPAAMNFVPVRGVRAAALDAARGGLPALRPARYGPPHG
jgi:hypothetical protein